MKTTLVSKWVSLLVAVVGIGAGSAALAQSPPPPTPTITSLTFNHLAPSDPGTLWAYLDVVGTMWPTQWSATGGVAPTGWVTITGAVSTPIVNPISWSFSIRVQIPATSGTRSITVTLMNDNTMTTPPETVSVTVSAPVVSALSVKSVAGLMATLNATATSTANEYAVMDGAWDASSAVWHPITGGTISSGNVTFSPTGTLKPQTGVHTISLAVRRTDFGMVSAARTTTTTLTGPGVYLLTVSSVSGATANLSVTVTGGPTEYAAMEGAWNAGAAVWQTIPAGTIVSGRLNFAASFAMAPTVGAHTIYVAVRDPALGLASAGKSVTATVIGPAVYAVKSSSVSGATANLSVTVTGGPTEYAAMEGAWNAGAAVWQTIPAGTIVSGRLNFAVSFALAPTVGAHTLYVAVRDPALGLASAGKSVTATVTGPAVYAVKSSSVSGATATLAVTVTGGPTQYCIMEGAWDVGSAVWQTIPAGTIVSGRLVFAANFGVTPTAGAHYLYVAARDPVTGLTSAAKPLTVTLAAPGMYALSSKGVSGTVVSLSITVSGAPDQFAVMDGAWDAGSAVWQTIPAGTIRYGRLVFAASSALQALAGSHTVYVAARNSALNATSAPKSVTVTVAAPAITSLAPASGGAGRTLVTLAGTAFGPSAGASGKVEFGGLSATLQSWTNTQIKCVVPQAAPLGAVNVIVTTSAGLVSAPRVFTVLPFWLGAWAGTFQDTADSEAGAGPLKHGWTFVTAAATPAVNGISLTLATAEILTGTLTPADGTFTTTGTRTDGTALTLSGTLLFGSLTGALTWIEPGGASGTSDYALTFPSTAKATVSGTYVGPTEDQFDSRGVPLIAKALLLTASQTGQTVTLTDAVFGTRMTGTLTGDIFVAVGTGMTIYGHVTATDAAGIVQTFEATYAWADSTGWGWGELDSGRSTGVVGVPSATTNWSLSAVSSFGGTVPLNTVITVSSYYKRITVTTTDPAQVKHTLTGKIYLNHSGVGSTFVARGSLFTLYGVLNGTAMAGSYEDDTPGDYDNGTCTGVKL